MVKYMHPKMEVGKIFILLVVSIMLMFVVGMAAQKVTLNLVQVFTSPQRTHILQSIINEFEALHPNVHINLISPPYESIFENLLIVDTSDLKWYNKVDKNSLLKRSDAKCYLTRKVPSC